MSSRLEGPLVKITRAKEHIRDLESQVQAFFRTNPYIVGTKRNPETRQLVYYLVGVRETPLPIAAVAGDVLHNLRSALDHLAHHLVCVGTGTSGPFRYVYFPIFGSATDYEAKKTRQIHGMRQEAIDVIDTIKPYKGGNDALWLLDSLNNIDKHRLLIPVGSAFRSVDFGAVLRQHAERSFGRKLDTAFQMFLRPDDRMCPLKAGDELFIDLPDAEVNEHMQFTFEIAFSEPWITQCEPLVETLQNIANLVENLVPSFEPLLQ